MSELQRGSTSTSVIDVLDHVLDKGIVIDAWLRVSVLGIDLITVEARVVVASIETYWSRKDAVDRAAPAITMFNRTIDWHPSPTRLPTEPGPRTADTITRDRRRRRRT
jgi:gas vesicle structural protein